METPPLPAPLPTVLGPARWADATVAARGDGDARRTRRLVAVAGRLAAHPDASPPAAPAAPAGPAMLTAGCRRLQTEAATVDALGAPRRAPTRQAAGGAGVTLPAQDTTAGDDTAHRSVAEAWPPWARSATAGAGATRRGACWRRDRTTAGCWVWPRWPRSCAGPGPTAAPGPPIGATGPASRVSGPRAAAAVGAPPPGARRGPVGDRGAGVVTCCTAGPEQGAAPLVRVAQDRRAAAAAGAAAHARQAAQAPRPAARRDRPVTARRGEPARTAHLGLAWTAPTARPPADVRGRAGRFAPAWAVRVWGPGPPPGVTALDRVLVTTVAVAAGADAWERVGWSERRWLVEEYRRGRNTGRRLEARRPQDRAAPWRRLGILAPTAVRLLQGGTGARADPDRPAAALLPADVVAVAAAKTGQPAAGMTARTCRRLIARLGGRQGRRGGGEPGGRPGGRAGASSARAAKGPTSPPPCPTPEMRAKARAHGPGEARTAAPGFAQRALVVRRGRFAHWAGQGLPLPIAGRGRSRWAVGQGKPCLYSLAAPEKWPLQA